MLVIRAEQLRAFALARVVAHLRARWPEQLTGERAGAVAAEALEIADGLALDDDATNTLAECLAVFGRPPWTAAWARPLYAAELPAPLRSARFIAAAREALAGLEPR